MHCIQKHEVDKNVLCDVCSMRLGNNCHLLVCTSNECEVG